MFKNYRLRDYDFKLIILVLALSAVGIMTIGSAEPAQPEQADGRSCCRRGDYDRPFFF